LTKLQQVLIIGGIIRFIQTTLVLIGLYDKIN